MANDNHGKIERKINFHFLNDPSYMGKGLFSLKENIQPDINNCFLVDWGGAPNITKVFYGVENDREVSDFPISSKVVSYGEDGGYSCGWFDSLGKSLGCGDVVEIHNNYYDVERGIVIPYAGNLPYALTPTGIYDLNFYGVKSVKVMGWRYLTFTKTFYPLYPDPTLNEADYERIINDALDRYFYLNKLKNQ